MSAEGKPPAEPSLLSRPLAQLARLVTAYPLVTVVLGVVAAVASLLVAQKQLKFQTNRADVLNPNSEYNRRWLRYTAEFGDEEDVVVVVEGRNAQTLRPVLDEIGLAIAREDRTFHAEMHRVDLSRIRSKGLYYLPTAELTAIDGFLVQLDGVLQGDWSQLSLGKMAADLGRPSSSGAPGGAAVPAAVQQSRTRFLEGFTAALAGRNTYQSPWPEMSPSAGALDQFGPRYLLANDGRLGFVLLRFTEKDVENFAQNSDAIDLLRKIIEHTKTRFPGVTIGLTGLPVMENDEMRLSQVSMSLVTCLSLGSVFLVLLVGFGCLRHSLMATAVLLLGTIWTVGYTAITVGYLNILSIAFGSILMGLGINYGIYYVARYLQLCETSRSTREALIRTAASVAPSITTSAATAACSFFMASFTDFRGVAQLGIIAGGGIMLCWLAAMTVLPALIQLVDARRFGRTLPAPLDLYMGLKLLYGRPRLILGLTLLGSSVVAVGIGRLRYDDNLLNLQPIGLESVELEHKLLTETNQSAWFALSVADSPADALRRKAGFLALPTVERVEEVASLFPADRQQKQEVIGEIHQRLANLPAQVPPIPVPSPQQLGQLATMVGQFSNGPAGNSPEARALARIPELLRQIPPRDFYQRLSDYQQHIAKELLERLQVLRSVSSPESPSLDDLPPSLVQRFVGHHGHYLLKIYAKGDIWDTAARDRFVFDVRRVDREATGNPLQVYEASKHMKHSYEQAAIYAFIAIVILLLVEFRCLHYPLMAMLPLVVGALQMFGIMGLLDIPLNSANLIVLPLIIGLGVENGIHIINDYRRRTSSYHRMSTATTTAVVINSLTTMVGFAALMIARHQGLQSLGRVLTIGMSCCLLSALVLPNILTLMFPASAEASWDMAAEEGHPARRPRKVPTTGLSSEAMAAR